MARVPFITSTALASGFWKMPSVAEGLPSKFEVTPYCSEPSSTRPTSETRTTEPSGLARRTMLPNSSGRVSRPLVTSCSSNGVARSIGSLPREPVVICAFCAWIDWSTVSVESASASILAGSSQMRMA